MTDSDLELLQEFARAQSQDAFTALVQRHVNLVYSAALRQVRSSQLAEEVAQSVFTDLARSATRLKPGTVLTAWLYEVTRRTAINVVRGEARRQLREQIAFEMNAMNATSDDWMQIEPLLDEAMHALDETDRTAVLLRYFENKSLREVGDVLGTSDDTAQKRVSRAVERLREFFNKNGVAVSTSGLVLVVSANSVQAAPAGLTMAISGAVTLAGTAITTTATATKAIAMTTLQKTFVAITLAAAVGGGFYAAREVSAARAQIQTLQQQQATLAAQVQQLTQERDEAARQLAGLRNSGERVNVANPELLKLRGEVTRLRAEAQVAARMPAGNTNDQALSEAVVWKQRVVQLKQYFEQSPHVKIPELQFATEQDWLDAARAKLNTETDYRRASSTLRALSEDKVGLRFQKALLAFMKGRNEQPPTAMDQLQPYFDSQIDQAILDRWKIAPASAVPSVGVGDVIITQKAAVDEIFDRRLVFGSGGGHGATDFLSSAVFETMRPVHDAYRAAHNGEWQTDLSELEPYARTPEQQAALQKLILRNTK